MCGGSPALCDGVPDVVQREWADEDTAPDKEEASEEANSDCEPQIPVRKGTSPSALASLPYPPTCLVDPCSGWRPERRLTLSWLTFCASGVCERMIDDG
jgi:hypothetical protein